jgi:hypothetical protein
MKKNYTHVSVILDRSGSMESIREDTIGGFNSFLRKQQTEAGTATLTLVQFDSQDPYEVIHRFQPIGTVPELTQETYVPRANTPLLDSLGRGINDLEQCLGEIKHKDQPSNVVVVVVTDGEENASQEFTKKQIEKMVREKSENDSWQFVFLSASLAAFGDARDIGIQNQSSLAFDQTRAGCEEVWNTLSCRTSDVRTGRKAKLEFEQQDRKRKDDPHKTKRP